MGPSKPQKAASHVLPTRKGLKFQLLGQHKPISEDKGHCQPSEVSELAFMLWSTLQNNLPSDEGYMQLLVASPYPTEMGQKQDGGEEKLPQGPQV